MTESNIEEIRITIEEAEAAIKLRDELNKLVNTPAFSEIIGKGYFQDESARLVALMGEDNLDEKGKAEVQKMMLGIAYFQRWLRGIVLEGNEMEITLNEAHDEQNREDY